MARRRRRLGVTALVALLVVGAGAYLLRHGAEDVIPLSPECQVAGPGHDPWTFDPEQAANAAAIAAEGMRRRLPNHAVTVALATAMQESKLRNVDYGDRDSVGLFQQRPSQGWGPRERLLQPAYAAGAFYGRLVRVPGWTTLPVTAAAQAVQHSAGPDAYAQHEDAARALARAFTGEAPASLSCRLPRGRTDATARRRAAAAARAAFGSPALGVSLSPRQAWAVASWAVATASVTGVQQVSLADRRWSRQEHWDGARAPAGTVTVS